MNELKDHWARWGRAFASGSGNCDKEPFSFHKLAVKL